MTTDAPSFVYQGRSSRLAALLPGRVREFLTTAGGMTELLVTVVWSAIRHPKGYWRQVSDILYDTLKQSWLSVTLAISGFSVFISVLTILFFAQAGATSLFPSALFKAEIEEFVMWATELVLAGVVGATLTSELGARKVREELDAMAIMGIDPIRELVLPRMIATMLYATLLAIPSAAIAMVSLQLGAAYYTGLNTAQFYSYVFLQVDPINMIIVVLNCFFVGVVIATICAYKGLTAGGGPLGLGKAVNQAVVISFVTLWIFQLTFASVTLGLLNLGGYR